MTEQQPFVVALTGHRPSRLAGYDLSHPFYGRLATRLAARVQRASAVHPQLELRTGMAAGADTVWAEVALAARQARPGQVRVVGYVPFPGQAARWPEQSQRRWAQLRAQLDAEHVTAQTYSVQALHQRNRDMLTGADLVIAIWDRGTTGGTASTVHSAQAAGQQVLVIEPGSV